MTKDCNTKTCNGFISYCTRSGSYFSDYNYEYAPLEVRQLVRKVIPQQIIPERTIVTFKEGE